MRRGAGFFTPGKNPFLIFLLAIAAAMLHAGRTLGDEPPTPSWNLIFEGDSQTQGGNLGVNHSYPTKLAALPGSAPHTFRNVGTSGMGIGGLFDGIGTRVQSQFDPTKANCVFVWAGTNDLFFSSPAANVIEDLAKECRVLKNFGCRVVVFSPLKRTSANTPPGYEAQRLAVVSSLQSNWQNFADYFCDVGSDARMSSTTNTTYFDPDQVHLSSAGYDVIAGYAQSALSSITAMGPHVPVTDDVVLWYENATAVGGTVSSTTLAAVTSFRDGCVADGIWGQIKDCNLFCGSFMSALTRLKFSFAHDPHGPYRGHSYGSGLVTLSDYIETGSSGGFQGNGSKKIPWFYTPSLLGFTGNNAGITVYFNQKPTPGAFRGLLGSAGGPAPRLVIYPDGSQLLGTSLTQSNSEFLISNSLVPGTVTLNVINGIATGYCNGTLKSTVTLPPQTVSNVSATTLLGEWTGRLNAVIIHDGLDATQTTALHSRLAALQAALSRDMPQSTPLQSWRARFYGTTADAGIAADSADPYGTGIPNLAVYAFLGPAQHPARASAGQLPQPEMSDDSYTYSFTQPSSVSDVTYGAEWSETLQGDWQSIPDTGTGTQHIFSLPRSGQPRIFMRLRVTSP